jgi:hypothetical protein
MILADDGLRPVRKGRTSDRLAGADGTFVRR